MRPFNNPSEILDKTNILDRFLTYVKFDTQSDDECQDCPSTAKQLELGKHLVKELKSIGLDNASMDGNGYVTAELKGNGEGMLGLCAHMDTATAFSGTDVSMDSTRRRRTRPAGNAPGPESVSWLEHPSSRSWSPSSSSACSLSSSHSLLRRVPASANSALLRVS